MAQDHPNSNSIAIPLLTFAFFAMPSIMQGFMHGPATSLIQGIYAKHAGLSLAAIGTVIMLTRFFDAVTDPIIGHYSDRERAHTGSRKRLIFFGTFLTALSLWFLYRPPDGVSIFYFGGWFALAYLGWTITEIPYRAWSIDLTSDYVERTKLSTVIAAGMFLGTLLFYVLPIVSYNLGVTPTKEINLDALAVTAVIVVLIMPLLNFFTLWTVPDGELSSTSIERPDWKSTFHSIQDNKPLRLFIGVFLIQGGASGLLQGASYLYVENHLQLGEHFALILVLSLPASILAIPIWGWACTRLQKHTAWALGLTLSAICYLGFSFIPPGEDGLVFLIPLYMLLFIGVASTWVAPPAILGDIADYGRLKQGEDHTGAYFAVYTFMQKAAQGLGVAASFYVLALFKFDAQSSVQTQTGTFGLLIGVSIVPAILTVFVVFCVLHFPVTRERHALILKALDKDKSIGGRKRHATQ